MNFISKIRGLSTAVSVISILTRVFLGIAIVALIAAITFLCLIPKDFLTVDLDGSITASLQSEALIRPLPDDLDYRDEQVLVQKDGDAMQITLQSDRPLRVTERPLYLALISPCVQLIALFVVLCFVGSFAKALRQNHSPFCGGVVSRLKGIGWSLVGWALAPALASALCSIPFLSTDGFRLNLDINLTLVLFVLLFLLLVYIFSYGAKLQEESDTTL